MFGKSWFGFQELGISLPKLLEALSTSWKPLERSGRPWKDFDNLASSWEALRGLGSPWEALDDLGSFWYVSEGLGRSSGMPLRVLALLGKSGAPLDCRLGLNWQVVTPRKLLEDRLGGPTVAEFVHFFAELYRTGSTSDRMVCRDSGGDSTRDLWCVPRSAELGRTPAKSCRFRADSGRDRPTRPSSRSNSGKAWPNSSHIADLGKTRPNFGPTSTKLNPNSTDVGQNSAEVRPSLVHFGPTLVRFRPMLDGIRLISAFCPFRPL